MAVVTDTVGLANLLNNRPSKAAPETGIGLNMPGFFNANVLNTVTNTWQVSTAGGLSAGVAGTQSTGYIDLPIILGGMH